MPTLKECMESIRTLVKEKGFEDEFKDEVIFAKGLFAIMELTESLELIKKHGLKTMLVDKYMRDSVSEELIDSIFYILDLYGILCRDAKIKDPDAVFEKKLAKNLNREFKYGRPE